MSKAVSLSSSFAIFLIVLLMLSGNVFFSFDPGGYNNKRIIQIVGLLALWVIVLLLQSIRSAIRDQWQSIDRPVQILLLIFFGCGLFAALLSDHPFKALQEVSLFVLLMMASLFIAALSKHKQFLFIVANCFCIGIIYYSFIYFLNYRLIIAYGPAAGAKNWMFSLINFAAPRNFNQIQILLIPLMSMLCVLSSGWKRILPFGCLVLLAFFVLVSGGRGILLAWASVFVVIMVIGRAKYVPMAFWQLSALAIGFLLYYLLILNVTFPTSQVDVASVTALERVSDGSNGRFILWQAAWDFIKQNPFFGIGPQHYIYQAGMTATPHNLLFTIGSEWGMVALICISVVIAYAFLLWSWRLLTRSNGDDEHHIKEIGLFSALLGALVYSMFSSVQITPFSQTVLFIVIGLALGVCLPEKQVKFSSVISWVLFVVVVITGCYFFGFTFQEFFDPDAVLVLEGQTNDPRIWTNGRMGDYPSKLIW